jgi:NADH:ubiquinone oxidoreductase subunit 3 (subunit A)
MSGENERGQRIYPPFYDEFFSSPRDALPSPFEQKLSARNTPLTMRYRLVRFLFLIFVIIATIILVPMMFVFTDIRAIMLFAIVLIILYYFVVKLYILEK